MKKITLNVDELAYICSQMNIILNSGLSVQEGLEVLLEDTSNTTAKEILKSLYDDIADKQTLYKALKNTGVFPGYMTNMVKIGEITGRLEEVFAYLSEYYENESDLRKTIKSVLFQPIILLMMMFLVVAVLVAKIIPTFMDIFNRLNMDTTDTFKKTMSYSMNTGITVLVILAVIIVVSLVAVLMLSTTSGKKIIFRFIDSFGPTKAISLKLAQARFCRAMTVMIKSGVDTTEALEHVGELINSKRFKAKIENCHKKLLDNKGFAETLSEEKVFDGMHNQMLKVSYKTGAYETTWEKISNMYSNELKDSLYGIIGSVEPIVVAILTVTIGAILISVMLPLMGIMSSIG
ncbi:MAG: type II secretion system F family protein [Lachnospiraceae bacterium]|nr:type II secretion system F family protein [Lachnospiraceae bacterium]